MVAVNDEVATKADKADVVENTVAIGANTAAIEKETNDRVSADQKLQNQITVNSGMIANEKTERENADKELDGKITDNKNAIAQEAIDRDKADKELDEKFTGEVSRLDNKIDKLDDRVEKVGAMAAAIANLHTMGYDPAAPTEFAVGVGQYRDKTGVALGAFHYPNRDFMLSFSVSSAGDEYMGGIGATWRIGRKSPEKMRQDAAEKAVKARLAKAEADKKAAKDARVAAQQKRHAEMLAAKQGK